MRKEEVSWRMMAARGLLRKLYFTFLHTALSENSGFLSLSHEDEQCSSESWFMEIKSYWSTPISSSKDLPSLDVPATQTWTSDEFLSSWTYPRCLPPH